MTTTTITPDMMLQALMANDDLMSLLEEQILSSQAKRVSKPVGKRSTVEKLENPLPTHNESEHVTALKTGKKAKQGRATTGNVKPGKVRKAAKKATSANRSDIVDHFYNACTQNCGHKENWADASYREVQAIAKLLNVSAKGCKADVIERCCKHKDNQKKATSSTKRNWEGLSYRQTQRLVKWTRENVTSFEQVAKNTGWDNVQANAEAVLDNEMFWKLMDNDKYENELNEYLGTEFITAK